MSEISHEDEILDEIETGLDRDILAPFKQIFVFLTLAVFVIFIGIFIGDALFGKRSFEVLRDLQKEKAFLYQDTERLKKKMPSFNATIWSENRLIRILQNEKNF